MFEPTDLQYLWLPMSHSFGKSLLCGIIHVGVPTYVDGRVDKLVDMLAVVKPDADVRGAADLREGLQPGGHDRGLGDGGLKAKIFSWAVDVGKKKVALEQAGRSRSAAVLKAQYAVAERLVFSKLQNRLGGRLRVLVSGSAPLSRDIAEFFAAAGLPIMEGYGLTEIERGQLRQPARQAEDRHGRRSRSATSSAGSTPTGRSCCAARP